MGKGHHDHQELFSLDFQQHLVKIQNQEREDHCPDFEILLMAIDAVAVGHEQAIDMTGHLTVWQSHSSTGQRYSDCPHHQPVQIWTHCQNLSLMYSQVVSAVLTVLLHARQSGAPMSLDWRMQLEQNKEGQ